MSQLEGKEFIPCHLRTPKQRHGFIDLGALRKKNPGFVGVSACANCRMVSEDGAHQNISINEYVDKNGTTGLDKQLLKQCFGIVK